MNKPKLNMIVCVGENNLIGDRVPEGNGLLWEVPEELKFFKEKTINNIVVFGENTAKYVPIDKIGKNRTVHIVKNKEDCDFIIKRYENTDNEIYICGGRTVYEYFLRNYQFDRLYISKLKPHIKVKIPKYPLFLPEIDTRVYKSVMTIHKNDFVVNVYEGIDSNLKKI